jgi:WD40 repeat protein
MKVHQILFFTLLSFHVFGQDDKVLIPTPEAASLIKWSKNEVNLSTGSVNSFIPLYTLKDGDLEVPIALHYNGSSGIKVDEAATCVGLGWDLVAGGKIVRMVRDKPDEGYSFNPVRNERGGIDYIKLGGTLSLDSLLLVSSPAVRRFHLRTCEKRSLTAENVL